MVCNGAKTFQNDLSDPVCSPKWSWREHWLRFEGRQNSLLPLGTAIKCFVIPFWRMSPFRQCSPKVTKCFFKVFILTLSDHFEYNSLTDNLPDCVLIISALIFVLVTQEFPVIIDSYLLVQLQYIRVKIATPYSHWTWQQYVSDTLSENKSSASLIFTTQN